MDNTNTIISLRQISKIFYTDEVETHALSEVDMEIFEGEFLAINGPSGCGKSTLLSIIGLLDTPPTGSTSSAAGRCRT